MHTLSRSRAIHTSHTSKQRKTARKRTSTPFTQTNVIPSLPACCTHGPTPAGHTGPGSRPPTSQGPATCCSTPGRFRLADGSTHRIMVMVMCVCSLARNQGGQSQHRQRRQEPFHAPRAVVVVLGVPAHLARTPGVAWYRSPLASSRRSFLFPRGDVDFQVFPYLQAANHIEGTLAKGEQFAGRQSSSKGEGH